jgi:hypothetical protein
MLISLLFFWVNNQFSDEIVSGLIWVYEIKKKIFVHINISFFERQQHRLNWLTQKFKWFFILHNKTLKCSVYQGYNNYGIYQLCFAHGGKRLAATNDGRSMNQKGCNLLL